MARTPNRLDGLRLRHLRILELIDEHRSLRAVGQALNRTQPAVSQMVKDLEYAFGIELVARSVRGVELTPAGHVALERARSGLSSFDQLLAELKTSQSPTLRIGTNPALIFNLLPMALRALDAENGTVRYRISTGVVGDLLRNLWDGQLDCYVGRIDWDHIPKKVMPVLRHDPLARTDLVLACSRSHPLAGRADIDVAELADWAWLLPLEDSNNRIALEKELRNHGVALRQPMMELNAGPGSLITLTREMQVLTLTPRFMLETRIAGGEVVALDIPGFALPQIQVGFVTLAEHETMASVRAFRQALKEAAEALATEHG
ncbi:LysR family transcriptional regulator [Martelella soudanensis]|uniref:LysR family transcriptional regulator n=1 Tax=unclassified Martelella TaxID=2629616 RepID=UPI0015DF47A6|nr:MULTISPECIES: LysR substrate-binding domain-containing protein [unclassified Martelella]